MGKRTYCRLTRDGWHNLIEKLAEHASLNTDTFGSARLNISALRLATGLNRRTVKAIVDYSEEIGGCECKSLTALCKLCGYHLVEADVECPSEARATCTAPRQSPEVVSQRSFSLKQALPGTPTSRDSGSLPTPQTSLVSRPQQKEIRNLFTSHQLITLTGTGGVGKTRLAIEVAREIRADFPDGAEFVDLTSVQDSAQVPWAVARVLMIPDSGDAGILDKLTQALKFRTMLLVIDNCEHVIEGSAALAATLLRKCENIKILATSHERLRIAGEHTYHVPSLSVPPLPERHVNQGECGGSMVVSESLLQYEAMQLFIERALLVDPDFTVNNGNAPTLASICRQLEGIPLAIELAAALKGGMTLEAINAGLNDPFDLLTEGFRDGDPRHRTLRAVIDWAYKLLNDQEKVLLNRLSVFVGGCTSEAAEQVCHDEKITDQGVRKLLLSLKNKSLLKFEEKEGKARYSLLETIHHYASEKLQERGEANLMRQRHQRCYLALSEEAEPHLKSTEQREWIRRLEEEHDNLRAALNWSLSEPSSTSLRFCGFLYLFWWKRGYLSEGRQWCALALKNASDHNRTLERAKVLYGIGFLANTQCDFSVARDHFQESLSIAQELGDKLGINAALNQLGIAAGQQGDYASACAYHTESLSAGREIGDKRSIATSLGNLGLVAQYQADYVSACAYHEQSLSIMKEIGDMEGIAGTLSNLGIVAFEQGDYVSARTYYDESLSLHREYGDPMTIAGTLINLGHIANVQTDYASAQDYYDKSLSLSREIGYKQGIAAALNSLGLVAQYQNEFEAARGYHIQSLSIRKEIGDLKGIAYSLCNLGYVAQYQADYASARTYYSDCLSLFEDIGDQWGIAATHCNLGLIAKYLIDYVSARTHYHESLSIFRKIKDLRCIASTLEALASLAAALKQAERAACLWGVAEVLREEIGAPLAPNDQEEYDRDVAAARAVAGEEALLAAWTLGRSMTLERAIEYALEEPYN
jgi:predicted ATPase/Tfp pilus assembly protein PilF